MTLSTGGGVGVAPYEGSVEHLCMGSVVLDAFKGTF